MSWSRTHLAVCSGEAHGSDQPREANRTVQLQQGYVVVVVEGLEVWMEQDPVHRTPGGVMLVPDVMETQIHLQDRGKVHQRQDDVGIVQALLPWLPMSPSAVVP